MIMTRLNVMEDKPEKLKQRFIVETITMTTVTERRIVTESTDSNGQQTEIPEESSKRIGILKGGKYWKNSAEKNNCDKIVNYNDDVSIKTSPLNDDDDDDGDGMSSEENEKIGKVMTLQNPDDDGNNRDVVTSDESLIKQPPETTLMSPESAELTLTFKLGQHMLVSNSLKPNSAMRQLFPGPRFLSPPPPEDIETNDTNKSKQQQPQQQQQQQQFLVTAESLKLFEESKKSKFLSKLNADDSEHGYISITSSSSPSKNDDNFTTNGIHRMIERNTLRRSLVKYSYEYRNKRLSEKKKNENSLEERIRQLTCGIDDDDDDEGGRGGDENSVVETGNDGENSMLSRSSPQGCEEFKEIENNTTSGDVKIINQPEVSTTTTTTTTLTNVPTQLNSSYTSGNSTYKKLTDLFSRKINPPPPSTPTPTPSSSSLTPLPQPIIEDINRNIKNEGSNLHCDLVLNSENINNVYPHNNLRNSFGKNYGPRPPPSTSDTKKQFLSTLAPLTACVNPEESEKFVERCRLIEAGGRIPSFGRDQSEYSLKDVEEGLKDFEQKKLGNQPDVIAETPQNETPNDELALFVQQDSKRMEKIKKRYSASDDKSDDDDDYGFNKRPFVKGVVTSQLTPATDNPQPKQQPSNPRLVCPNNKPSITTATGSTVYTTWPYYSQENCDAKHRQYCTLKQTEESNTYKLYSSSPQQEYRAYAEGSANYAEFKGVGQQRINYVNQQGQQQNIYSTTNTYYRCHPIRFGGYSELSNYQFRHPPHSPPPMRRILPPPQPSPNSSSEDFKLKPKNRVFVNKNTADEYCPAAAAVAAAPPPSSLPPGVDVCNRPKIPDGSNVISSPPEEIMKPPETIFHRTVPGAVHNPCLQMKFSPVNYHQGVIPTASIRFSATCSPHSIVDESNVIIEPHYSTFPNPQNQNTVGVIRVEQGQQMIRVPVPYATGAPVQVHLMAGRIGRCDSPQRPSSPQGAVKIPGQPYNHYFIAKGTQTAQTYSTTAIRPVPPQNSIVERPQTIEPVNKTVDFEKQGKAIAEELQHRQQKLALSRSLSQEANYLTKITPRPPSPNNPIVQQERGVPEGAASSSVQDSQPLPPPPPPKQENSVSTPAGNTIYYTMNV
ncbi:hypothetical protein Phum_PHUM067020 [Pediculus humanus corporis]|uniref:Uncharacterized protein n=1 Tax=Pediculus humanus subsp. corporis TaxID=121224 RepID=E0VBR3_PEDHC|nr:uncharacterized protein Phum_PHUM067020 [Pediculus humanus corporis]EEB10819.1 hypothetical protein Phum_PHUM067020 [Pediculus humanus corporis]